MTLVELLVVVMIMIILLGIAVPLMKPQLEDRRIREASRQLNAFMAAAQARAAATGRSVGISFSRTDNANSNISYQVYFAETPAPYVGDTTSARAVFVIQDIYDTNAPNRWERWQGVGKLFDCWSAAINGGSLNDIVSVGDLIQFNDKGPFYVITLVRFDANAQLTEFIFEAPPTDPHASASKAIGPALAPSPSFAPPTTEPHLTYYHAAPRNLNSSPGPDGRWGQAMADDNGMFGQDDVREIAWPMSDDYLTLHRVPFQIYRKPRRTTAGSLSLPNGTAVILGLSGFDGVIAHDPPPSNALNTDHHEFSAAAAPDATPVTVMFRPDGSVERVFYGSPSLIPGSVGVFADAPIHLLIGSALLDERLDPALSTPTSPPLPAAPAFPRNQDPLLWQNLNDLNNLWVTIGHRTGSITTAPMLEWQGPWAADAANPDRDTLVWKARYARGLTRSGQSVGGN
jgi:type II secretory pathway pseudopilin PulG